MVNELEKNMGYYFGTELYGIFFLRHKRDNLAARGRGEYWFGFDGLYFKPQEGWRTFTIFYSSIEKIKTGYFHALGYGKGHTITKIKWKSSEGLRLSSGFLFKQNRKEIEQIISKHLVGNRSILQSC